MSNVWERCDMLTKWMKENPTKDFSEVKLYCEKTFGDNYKSWRVVNCMCHSGACGGLHFQDAMK